MAAEVVGDDDVTRDEGWGELLLGIGEELFSVDGAVEDARCDDAVKAQTGNEGRCHPMSVWHASDHTVAAWCTAIAAGHIGRDPGFINEYQLRRVQLRLAVAPILSRRGDVGTVLLRRMLGLFFASDRAGAASSTCRAG